MTLTVKDLAAIAAVFGLHPADLIERAKAAVENGEEPARLRSEPRGDRGARLARPDHPGAGGARDPLTAGRDPALSEAACTNSGASTSRLSSRADAGNGGAGRP